MADKPLTTRFINAVLWILHTGPLGGICRPITVTGKTPHRRFTRWRDKGIWTQLLHTLANDQNVDGQDMEWLMLDSTHIKVHPHTAGAVDGNQAGPHKREAEHQTETFAKPTLPTSTPLESYFGRLTSRQQPFARRESHQIRQNPLEHAWFIGRFALLRQQ